MIRIPGLLKVAAVLALDFLAVSSLFNDPSIAALAVGAIALYVFFGGYLALFQEGATRWDQLPAYEVARLSDAKRQLTEDVSHASAVDISRLKVYLISADDSMQATAYGANCVSVSRGTLDNADPMTLNAVLAHEISHILNFDPEFNRAVLATIFVLCGVISVLSFAFVAVIFLFFLVCGWLGSWLGVMAFKGTSKVTHGIFSLLQKGIVVLYQTVMSVLSRSAEYRCDLYSASLDRSYGLQLAHFLTYAAPETNRQLTLTEALYRTHPPTPKRVARLEAYVNSANR